MKAWGRCALLLAGLAVIGAELSAEPRRDEASFRAPVTRYGHFALGRPHEYAQVELRTAAGATLALTLPDDQVFEDLVPRPVRLSVDGPVEWLTIVSARGQGARLALLGVSNGQLALTAQSAPIGTPNRWLNPVGVADLDGDGQAEVAAVITPHIGGTLKIYRRRGAALVEVAARFGYSNHVYGSPELALSMPTMFNAEPALLVPDQHRRRLRVVRFSKNTLNEIGGCDLPAPIIGPLTESGGGAIAAVLQGGQRFELPPGCLR